MKERPILFQGAMVRAILDGSKTQTRRIMNPQPVFTGYSTDLSWRHSWAWKREELVGRRDEVLASCPHGKPCDRLWVRETFFAYGRWETRFSEKKRRDEWHFIDMTMECGQVNRYAADNPDLPLTKGRGARAGWYKRPAIFMPRAASRIVLENVSVRVERLQDISEVDAIAEGATHLRSQAWDRQHFPAWRYQFEEAIAAGLKPPVGPSPRQAYGALWESINGAGSWAANPWVWVVEFSKVKP
jgi:hypothetical protein